MFQLSGWKVPDAELSFSSAFSLPRRAELVCFSSGLEFQITS